MSSTLSEEADLLTEIMLMVFRVNGRLLERGDELVGPIGLTSARWQVLGAIGLSSEPLTAPHVAESMGITRQGAQKQLNLLLGEGMVVALENPRHARSQLYTLSAKGRRALDGASALHARWVKRLARDLEPAKLKAALRHLEILHERLAAPVSSSGAKP